MVFYPVYVTVVIGILAVDLVPFIVSFTVYFLALLITEALYLKALVAKTSGLATIN